MRIFISYSRIDGEFATKIRATLSAAGFDCFLDTRDLPPGEEFHTRIRDEIAQCDFFIFLVSLNSTRAGSYALTELEFAEAAWPNPAGRVLPVLLDGSATLPAYLAPVGGLVARGAVEAEVLDWVQQRAVEGDARPHSLTPLQLQLKRWAKTTPAPAPLRRDALGLPLSYIVQVKILQLAGILALSLVFVACFYAIFLSTLDGFPTNSPMRYLLWGDFLLECIARISVLAFPVTLVPRLYRWIRETSNTLAAIRDVEKLVAEPAMTLTKQGYWFWHEVAVETASGERVTGLRPISENARWTAERDIGWVYIYRERLVHVETPQKSRYRHKSTIYELYSFIDSLFFPLASKTHYERKSLPELVRFDVNDEPKKPHDRSNIFDELRIDY